MEGQSLHATLIGATIGNYRVVAKLGEGGMGAVYLAEHPMIGKKVALKVLHEEYASNQEVVTRFFNEARAVNDIGHPNIVDIIDYGVVQAQGYGPNFVYFIMEFLQGESLAALLAREAPLDPARALHIALQVADALAASHQKGIVHRDLKPDNVYLIPRGRERDFVKLLDFGIAKLTGDQGGSKRTRTGIVMGTPAYMSPEQCEGRGNIDHRTDVYAMGILLYEMITGRVPFAGEGYGEVLVQHLTRAPARPSTIRGVIPPAVEAIVMKALEKRREDRYASMDEFMNALRDPDGYVEQMGGLGAFYNLNPAMSMPTMPLQAGTGQPYYGSQPGVLPLPPGPATMAGVPRPTTIGSSAGQVVPGPSRRLPVIVGSAAVVLLLIGGGLFLFQRPETTVDPTPPVQPAVNPEPVKPEPPEPEAVKPDVKPEPDPKAQTPPPEPDKAPEAPQQVTILVVSVPPGAGVFVGEEADARGKTPLELKLDRADAEAVLTVKLAGYKPKSKVVNLSRGTEFEVALERERSSSSSRGDRPRSDRTKPDKPEKPDVKPDKPEKPTPTVPVDDDDVLEPKF
jgi:eukaryotic-like serine/threonine-protein kinase